MNCVRKHLRRSRAAGSPRRRSGARRHPADLRRAGRRSGGDRLRSDRARSDDLRRCAGGRSRIRHRCAARGRRTARMPRRGRDAEARRSAPGRAPRRTSSPRRRRAASRRRRRARGRRHAADPRRRASRARRATWRWCMPASRARCARHGQPARAPARAALRRRDHGDGARQRAAAGATPSSCWRWRSRSTASRASTRSPATPTASTAREDNAGALARARHAGARRARAGSDAQGSARRQRRLRFLRRARRPGRDRTDAAPTSTISARSSSPDAAAAANGTPGESRPHDTPTASQDRRHPGPPAPAPDPAPVRGRRRRVPAQLQSRHARGPRGACADPQASSDEPGGRSASSPTCRARSCASARSPTGGSSCGRRPFRLDLDDAPRRRAACDLAAPGDLRGARSPAPLLLDDGKLRLAGREVRPDFAETTVLVGGRLSDRKGVNVPDVRAADLAADARRIATTSRSRSNSASTGSRSPSCSGRRTSPRRASWSAGRAAVLAKLEKPSAIEHLDEIVELSDAVMVARGDLGVEMPPEEVPLLQKRIIARAAASAASRWSSRRRCSNR